MYETEKLFFAIYLQSFSLKIKTCGVELDMVKINKAINLCENLTSSYDSSHNLVHHFKVCETALEILCACGLETMQNLESLTNLIIYSALLHDTIDHKYMFNIKHKIKVLKSFLKENLAEDWINIKWIIDNVSYSKEVKSGYPTHSNNLILLARDIVSDADKIQAIGQVGIDRCKTLCKVLNPHLSDPEINRLVVIHCQEKLIKLKDFFIRTPAGKELAKKDHDIIVAFIENN